MTERPTGAKESAGEGVADEVPEEPRKRAAPPRASGAEAGRYGLGG
ncbi:hypothetical protein [Haladaptatus sp. R4]|nr:hypothetical protein [Haladaptatus sp. R4]